MGPCGNQATFMALRWDCGALISILTVPLQGHYTACQVVAALVAALLLIDRANRSQSARSILAVLWRKRHKGRKVSAWGLLPLCATITLLCGVHFAFGQTLTLADKSEPCALVHSENIEIGNLAPNVDSGFVALQLGLFPVREYRDRYAQYAFTSGRQGFDAHAATDRQRRETGLKGPFPDVLRSMENNIVCGGLPEVFDFDFDDARHFVCDIYHVGVSNVNISPQLALCGSRAVESTRSEDP